MIASGRKSIAFEVQQVAGDRSVLVVIAQVRVEALREVELRVVGAERQTIWSAGAGKAWLRSRVELVRWKLRGTPASAALASTRAAFAIATWSRTGVDDCDPLLDALVARAHRLTEGALGLHDGRLRDGPPGAAHGVGDGSGVLYDVGALPLRPGTTSKGCGSFEVAMRRNGVRP